MTRSVIWSGASQARPMASNNWQTQPRDPEMGRWVNRSYWMPRRHEIKIRLNYQERRMIEDAASAAGKTLTDYIVQACRDHRPHRSGATAPDVTPHQARLAARLPQNRGRR